MSEAAKQSELRSALNRMASLDAGQQQIKGDVERLRNQLHSVLILCVYSVGMSFVIYMAVRGLKGSS